jgi:CHAD domain-containing protein
MAKAKEIEGLDCGAEVGQGVRLVLGTRLGEMCDLRAAALDWSDPEGVHDMRVASRRLRSAIRDFSPYLRKRKLRRVKDELKSLADALGLVRDDDVAIMALEKLAGDAPPEVWAGVRQFTDERQRRRERARARLERALTEDALAGLREDFDDALAGAVKAAHKLGDDGGEKGTGANFRRGGREIILARLAEFQELSQSLYSPLKPEPLHRLRIAAKRLRYAVELFAACWAEGALAPFAKEIARMQTSLGELHDCDVWVEEIGEALKPAESEAAGAGDVAGEQKRGAAFWLLDHFTKERTGHFQDALARWREWEATQFQAQLARLLKEPAPVLTSTDAETPTV